MVYPGRKWGSCSIITATTNDFFHSSSCPNRQERIRNSGSFSMHKHFELNFEFCLEVSLDSDLVNYFESEDHVKSPIHLSKRACSSLSFRRSFQYQRFLFRSLSDPWCQDSSVVRFLRLDPIVSGWNPPSAEPSIRVGRFVCSLQFLA